jgi:hypothetical protein
MAWTTPRTFVAAAVLTAAQLNETRDNLKALLPLDIAAYTAWTPTITQVGNPTKTVTYARYQQFGKMVTAYWKLAVTSAGTTNNAITVSIPVTAKQSDQYSGTFVFTDQSTGAIYVGTAQLASTTTVQGLLSSTSGVTAVIGVAPNLPLASGDTLWGSITYEAA